jgi:hypothetical protein
MVTKNLNIVEVSRSCGKMYMFLLRCVSNFEWNRTFFSFSLIVEGATEMVLQLILSPKSIYNKNLGFIEQKMHLEQTERLKK